MQSLMVSTLRRRSWVGVRFAEGVLALAASSGGGLETLIQMRRVRLRI